MVDLAPGTAFPDHAHGGPVFVSVVEGTLWERSGGRETTLRAGETLYEETGRVHEAVNPGPGPTRLLLTVLLPKGAGLTTDVRTGAPQDLPAGATVAAQAVLENLQPGAPLDVVQRVTDLPVGGAIAPHTHPGPNLNVLLQGQVVLNMQGTAQDYRAGDGWVEPAGVVHGGANTGPTTVRLGGECPGAAGRAGRDAGAGAAPAPQDRPPARLGRPRCAHGHRARAGRFVHRLRCWPRRP